MLALALLLACQEPFGTDRHLLAGDRVAALTAEVGGGEVRPHLLLVTSGRLWTDEEVHLAWHWTDDPAALLPEDEPAATGPAPVLDHHEQTHLSLVASFPSGDRRLAVLDLDGQHQDPLPPLTVEIAGGADFVPVDGEARLGWGALPLPVPRVRWMATGGTFLEVERALTDWFAATLVLDDGEVEARSPVDPGWVTVAALAVDEGLLPTWRVEELWVGEPPPGGRTASGRWLAGVEGHAGYVLGTLVADDEAPTGLRLEDVSPAEAGPPWGTEGLCAGASGPFDPSWLSEGRCTRVEVVGAGVVVEVSDEAAP